MPLMKSQKSSNCSNEFQSKVGGFRESVGEPFYASQSLFQSLDDGLIAMFLLFSGTHVEKSTENIGELLVNNPTALKQYLVKR